MSLVKETSYGATQLDAWDLKWAKFSAIGAGICHIVGTLLFFVREAIVRHGEAHHHKNRHGSYKSFMDLDPTYLLQRYENQQSSQFLTVIALLVIVFSWVLTLPPVLGLAEVFGSRRSLSQLMVVGFFSAAGLTVMNLIFDAGTDQASAYLAASVVNSTYEEAAYQLNEKQVYRIQVIAISSFLVRSRELWLFGCTALFQAVGFFVASIQTYRTGKFNRYWAHLGMIMAFLGVLHFFADLGRDISWEGFSYTSFYITIAEYLIGFPIWIIWLGCEFRTFDLDEMTSILNSQPVGNDGL